MENEFFKYALKGNSEKSQKYLAIGICQVLDIADGTIVNKEHFKKSDNQFFKRTGILIIICSEMLMG